MPFSLLLLRPTPVPLSTPPHPMPSQPVSDDGVLPLLAACPLRHLSLLHCWGPFSPALFSLPLPTAQASVAACMHHGHAHPHAHSHGPSVLAHSATLPRLTSLSLGGGFAWLSTLHLAALASAAPLLRSLSLSSCPSLSQGVCLCCTPIRFILVTSFVPVSLQAFVRFPLYPGYPHLLFPSSPSSCPHQMRLSYSPTPFQHSPHSRSLSALTSSASMRQHPSSPSAPSPRYTCATLYVPLGGSASPLSAPLHLTLLPSSACPCALLLLFSFNLFVSLTPFNPPVRPSPPFSPLCSPFSTSLRPACIPHACLCFSPPPTIPCHHPHTIPTLTCTSTSSLHSPHPSTPPSHPALPLRSLPLPQWQLPALQHLTLDLCDALSSFHVPQEGRAEMHVMGDSLLAVRLFKCHVLHSSPAHSLTALTPDSTSGKRTLGTKDVLVVARTTNGIATYVENVS
ncbi:unnamed protein product [Closterium sp. NIES-54]